VTHRHDREQDAAVEQSTRIDVEAPVDRVWAVLREVERWPEWAPTVTSVRRLDDEPFAVGSRVRIEQPRIPATEYVVTELEQSRSFTWWPPARASARPLGTCSRNWARAVRA